MNCLRTYWNTRHTQFEISSTFTHNVTLLRLIIPKKRNDFEMSKSYLFIINNLNVYVFHFILLQFTRINYYYFFMDYRVRIF